MCGLALAAAAAAQETAWTIEVAAPQTQLVSGRSMKLEARAYSAAGATIDGFVPRWNSSDAAVAAVDASGQVRGLRPGVARLDAADPGSGVTGSLVLYVYPARIRIEPPLLELRAGERARVEASALDADGKPLAGMRVEWVSGIPAVASVDAGGAVTARAEGIATLTAFLDVGAPDFQFSGQARVRVMRRPDYRITRLISSDSPTAAASVKAISLAAFADGDRAAYLATLSNGAQALVSYDRGRSRVLAVAGQYLDWAGRIASRFNQVSVNARGDIAATIGSPGEYCNEALLLYRLGRAPQVAETACNVRLGSGMGDKGQLAYWRWDNRPALVARREDGSRVVIAGLGDNLPGVGRILNINTIVTAAGGNVIFEVTGARGRGYFYWDGGEIRKLLLIGDTVEGQRITYLDWPVEIAPGDVCLRATGSNFSLVVRLKGGAATVVARNGQEFSGAPRLGWIHQLLGASGDSVAIWADAGPQRAAIVISGGSAAALGGFADWTAVQQGFLERSGSVLARGPGGAAAQRLFRLSTAGIQNLIEPGMPLGEPAPASIDSSGLPAGAVTGPVFRTAGDALVRVAGGGLETVIGAGDRLPSGAGMMALGALASSPSGDLAFTAQRTGGSGLYVRRSGRLQVVAENGGAVTAPGGRPIDWFPTWNTAALALNDRGQTACLLAAGPIQYLGLLEERPAAVQPVAMVQTASPVGPAYTNFIRVALDEAGRVAFVASLADGSAGLFLWEKGASRKILRTGETLPGGQRLTDISGLAAAGSRFFVRINFADGTQEIDQLEGTQPRPVVASRTPTSFGKTIDWFYGPTLVPFANGDVAFMAAFADGPALVVRKQDGRDVLVAATGEPLPGGDWLLGLFSASAGEPGDLFFTGLTSDHGRDRITVYQATPQ